ncbi:hypothetical protein AB5I41_05380 [Sphingomonas sp. MMS24-JH45]
MELATGGEIVAQDSVGGDATEAGEIEPDGGAAAERRIGLQLAAVDRDVDHLAQRAGETARAIGVGMAVHRDRRALGAAPVAGGEGGGLEFGGEHARHVTPPW